MLRPLHVAAAFLALLTGGTGFIIPRPWSTQQWCASVRDPPWPMAYSKSGAQPFEPKGRSASDAQQLGHRCTLRGAASKCSICESIACGAAGATTDSCALQVQGADWAALPRGVPTVSDTPWAVGGSHRNDFGAATAACVLLGPQACVDPLAVNLTGCAVRCWGLGSAAPVPTGSGWVYNASVGQPQGVVRTLAGSGEPGLVDGAAGTARFRGPQGVAVAASGVVFVADTENHAIRRVELDGTVTTVAGTGRAGYADGPAATAQFSFPTAVALFYDPATSTADAALVLVVADTNNHRIRLVRPASGTVETLSGRRGDPASAPGYGDGAAEEARFDHPSGLAVTDEGVVYVADKYNHVIRRVWPDGRTETVAGRVAPLPPVLGCPPPCARGVPGYADGNLTEAQFSYPSDVSLGPDNGTLLVVEGQRVRRITLDVGSVWTAQGVLSRNRVVTVAGSALEGERDGEGSEALFSEPRALVAAPEGEVYVVDSTSCRLRRVSPAARVAVPVSCGARLVDVVRPGGCASYDPPVDELGFEVRRVVCGGVGGAQEWCRRRPSSSFSLLAPRVGGRQRPWWVTCTTTTRTTARGGGRGRALACRRQTRVCSSWARARGRASAWRVVGGGGVGRLGGLVNGESDRETRGRGGSGGRLTPPPSPAQRNSCRRVH